MAGYRLRVAGYRKAPGAVSTLEPALEPSANVFPRYEIDAAFVDLNNTAFNLFAPGLLGIDVYFRVEIFLG